MSDRWVRLGSTLAVATLSLSACATTGSMNNDGFRGPSGADVDEGNAPRVSVHATFSSFGGSREIYSTFRATQDAYVLIGHIDADGNVRIVYPESPAQTGFVSGGHSYSVSPFWAGFESDYALRRERSAYYTQPLAARYSSYDGGTGYMFAIATYHPMKLDELAIGDKWATYKLDDDRDLQDPRGAIETLAEALTAQSGDDYDVEFARYFRSNSQTYASSYFSNDCISPYAMGWAGYGFMPMFGFGMSPWYFNRYAYDPYGFDSYDGYGGYGGCGYGYGYRYATIGIYPGYPTGYVPGRRYPIVLRPRNRADSAAVDSVSYRQRPGFRQPILPGLPNDVGVGTSDMHGGVLMGGSMVDSKSAPRPLRSSDTNGSSSSSTRHVPSAQSGAERDHDSPPPPPRHVAPPPRERPRTDPPPKPAPAPARTNRHP